MYGRATLDITQETVTRLNEEYGATKKETEK